MFFHQSFALFSQREFVRNRPKPFQSHDSRLVLTLLWHLWVHLFYLCINYIPRKPKHVVDLMMTSGRPGRSDGRGDPCAGCPGRLAGHHVWHPTFPHWVAFPFRHMDARLRGVVWNINKHIFMYVHDGDRSPESCKNIWRVWAIHVTLFQPTIFLLYSLYRIGMPHH